MQVLLLTGLFLLSACHNKVDDDVVARAYGNYLRLEDLDGLVDTNLSAEDSAAVINNYISQWLQQQVVLHKAEKNVSKDFQQELQNYKNSLITYEYERLVVQQLLDTNISDEEITQYYNNHRKDFLLKTNIVRAVYVKVSKEAPCVARLKKLMNHATISDDDMQEIQKLAATYGQDYNFDEEMWMPFQKLQSLVPIETYNEVAFLRDTRYTTVNDEKSVYVVNILEYKITDDVSPLEYERNHIRTILLNSRKIGIIKNMQTDLLKKAELDKEIQRYK